jgi:hypothetical protein
MFKVKEKRKAYVVVISAEVNVNVDLFSKVEGPVSVRAMGSDTCATVIKSHLEGDACVVNLTSQRK